MSSEMTIINGCPCHSWCGTLKNPHCSMAMSADHRSKFCSPSPTIWWRLHMIENFSSDDKSRMFNQFNKKSVKMDVCDKLKCQYNPNVITKGGGSGEWCDTLTGARAGTQILSVPVIGKGGWFVPNQSFSPYYMYMYVALQVYLF